jgi:hypothetical protein
MTGRADLPKLVFVRGKNALKFSYRLVIMSKLKTRKAISILSEVKIVLDESSSGFD